VVIDMDIVGWVKINDNQKGMAIKHFYKWRRVSDNAFLEVSDAKDYGYKEGFIALLWHDGVSKPSGIAGSLSLKETYAKAIDYMKKYG
jgi:hypothetical protein